jgi:RNA-binding protein YlmH
MKGIINQEDIKIINIYGPCIDASNFIKRTLSYIKEQIRPYTIIVGDFNTPFSIDSEDKKLTKNLQ